MGAPKLPFQPDEVLFLKQNFYKLTNEDLREHINKFRAPQNQLSCHAFRNRCYLMGFKRGVQIRWSQEDIKKLKSWYKIMGNTQIAELLNIYGTSSRIIDGEKIKRIFTKKHVEKKLILLEIRRSEEQIKNIMNDHRLCGNLRDYTSNDNLWTRGFLIAAKEGEIRIRKNMRVIKINGEFIPYARWFYNQFIAPVPDNMKVYHIDMDPLNDEPENLELSQFHYSNRADYQRALPLIETRLQREQKKAAKKWEQLLSPDEKSAIMKEIARLTNIKENIERKLTVKSKPVSKYYEPIEAF